MSPTVALLVAAWLAIVVLALALAGLLRQVRELQTEVASLSRFTPAVVGRAAPKLANRRLLLVDARCLTCAEIVQHAGTYGLTVVAADPSDKWPAGTIVAQETCVDLAPPYLRGHADPEAAGRAVDAIPVSDESDLVAVVGRPIHTTT